ncbi:Dabb family protein [Olivibacter sp. SDN3]|uniref:Dabb family protein n=1 Tax=Olivibacter sp. SDN3 TaxID=2764720 RepID=UPI001651412D|nr:Dabb family protein [Olivibacter sp. SDN3]QNL50368.1 Dabb family protein [Olivibacter sp. SDN3]
MKRRNFLKKSSNAATILGISTIIPQACSNPVKEVSDRTNESQITHYVLFWLKDDLSEEQINGFSGFFEELRKVPNVKSLHYGKSVNSTARDVVDNTFTYNLLVYFDSLEDLETYGTHPIHLNAIDQYSKYWGKVVVHDSELK